MRRSTKDEKKEEVQGPTPAQKDGDGAPLEPSFEGAASDRSFSRREAVGLTGAALAGFATLAVAKANPAIAETSGSGATSARGTAAKPRVMVQEAKIEGGKAQPTLEVVTSLLKHRQYWGRRRGQWILTLTSPVFRRTDQVYVSIHEGFFIGAARYTVHNIAPRDGAIDIWINIEWGSDIDLYADYLIVR